MLLTALRGCDGVFKEDASKPLVRHLRQTVLVNADDRSKFMFDARPDEVDDFISDIDHYPIHWYTHFMHAAEIVAYKHPVLAYRTMWLAVYYRMADALHLRHETVEELDHRLA